MNLGQMIKLARIRLRDKTPPYLWDDDDLTEFANSSVSEAVMRTRMLQTQHIQALPAGVEGITLPFTVLEPQGALFLDHSGSSFNAGSFTVGRWYLISTPGTTDFTLIGATDSIAGTVFRATGVGVGTGVATLCNETPLLPMSQGDYFSARAYLRATPTRPTHYIRGYLANTLIIYPPPKDAGTLVLVIRRLTTEADEMVMELDEPVIPSEFHRDLVYWMLAEAYQVHDSDKIDAGAAARYEAQFDARFGKKVSARAEVQGRRTVIGSDVKPQVFGGSIRQSYKY